MPLINRASPRESERGREKERGRKGEESGGIELRRGILPEFINEVCVVNIYSRVPFLTVAIV